MAAGDKAAVLVDVSVLDMYDVEIAMRGAARRFDMFLRSAMRRQRLVMVISFENERV